MKITCTKFVRDEILNYWTDFNEALHKARSLIQLQTYDSLYL